MHVTKTLAGLPATRELFGDSLISGNKDKAFVHGLSRKNSVPRIAMDERQACGAFCMRSGHGKFQEAKLFGDF